MSVEGENLEVQSAGCSGSSNQSSYFLNMVVIDKTVVDAILSSMTSKLGLHLIFYIHYFDTFRVY